MHHESYDDLKHRILLTYGAKYDAEQEQLFSARLDFLEQLQERAETLLDFQNPRLRYFFERIQLLLSGDGFDHQLSRCKGR